MVKTATKTDAKPIVEEEDLMQQLLGQEARGNDDPDRPYLAQMVEIMQEGNRRVQQELEHFLKSSFNMCGFDSDFFPECKSKSISGGFIHQAGVFGVKCFSIFCGLILVKF